MVSPTSGSTSSPVPSSAAVELLAGLPSGTRVSVRYALPADDTSGLPLTDALGELLAADEESVTVRTRRGDVLIGAGGIRAVRVVPPAPPRRRPRGA